MSRTVLPETYSDRDLLLFTQLLHTNGLVEPSAITPENARIDAIASAWYSHPSTQLSVRDGLHVTRPLTRAQVCQLYQNLLEANSGCKNTTDLANKYYFQRVAQLEERILQDQTAFLEVLARDPIT